MQWASPGEGLPAKIVYECIETTDEWTIGFEAILSQGSIHCEADSEENKDVVGAFSHRCRTILHRMTKKNDVSLKMVEQLEPKSYVCRAKGLMYIDMKINRKSIKVMIDTGATQNYFASPEVEGFGLVPKKSSGKIKAINSVTQPIAGVSKFVLIKFVPSKERTNLSIVQMDDFKLIWDYSFFGIR
ncbi:Uncharacterized protein Adt_31257 [Abeliophyllum distichum]|uniref:Uncharacterized protein n=1 Tax=Abeliophyllum distichum TaxID=126358 RepID=A0ABD1RDJ9_9LAMI